MATIRTFAAGVFYRAYRWAGGSGKLFPGASGRGLVPTGLTLDQKDLLSKLDHQQILNAGRHIYNSFPAIQGAIDDKANAVVGSGWGAQFDGEDVDWGDIAEHFLWRNDPHSDVRGAPYNTQTNTHLGSVHLDRDGEFFIHLVHRAGRAGQTQFLESHRIGNRYHNTGYGDAQVRNGIAYNAYGRPIAYHFLGEDRELDKWIPARDIIHVFDPKWFSQGRGVSPLIYGILDWLDIAATRENEKVAHRIFSSLALKAKSKTGKPHGYAQDFGLSGRKRVADSGAQSEDLTEEFVSGMTRYLRINDEDLEAFDMGSRPSVNAQAFEERVMRGAFSALGWTYEQSYDASKLGGANVRRDIAKNQRSAERRQWVLYMPWTRIQGWRTAVAMKEGMIPVSAEWNAWTPQLPAKMTADDGNQAKADREDYLMGGLTLREYCARRGAWWKEHRKQRYAEQDDLLSLSKQLADKYDLPLSYCVDLMERRTPNGTTIPDGESTTGQADAEGEVADETNGGGKSQCR